MAKKKYNAEIKKIDQIKIKLKPGETAELPEKVKIYLTDEIYSYRGVDWEAIDYQQLTETGHYRLKGDLHQLNYPEPLVEQRADPYIYRHQDGYYYFTGSHPDYDQIVLRRSQTIAGLKDAAETVIWQKHAAGKMSQHIWAPEIHFINDKWYIYFAASKTDDIWALRPYVLECSAADPLQGKWVEKGEIDLNFKSFSLDATTFTHQNKRYLVWAQKVNNNTISNLYIGELVNPWQLKDKQFLLSKPEYDWETIGFDVNEGAAVLKRNDKIFISFSASETSANYCMGLLEADQESNLLDKNSWHKSEQPVFSSSELTSLYGPGHNSFIKSEDGITDLLVYHARPYKKIEGNPLYDPNRHGRIQELFWQKNGKPYFAYPGLRVDDRKVVSAEIQLAE